MVAYYGDFPEDDTVNIPFNTFDSNDPQASVTITNLANADIMVHKDGGLTQIATDGATVVIDFDSITGNHMITIDTSVSADYSTGSEYAVRIEGTTVDAGTINAWVGSFSIERAGGALAVVKLLQAAVITNAAGVDIAADIIGVKAETALIVADTNELQTDNVPGLIAALNDVAATDIVSAGAITTLSGAIVNVDLVDTTTTNTDMVGTAGANTVVPDAAGVAPTAIEIRQEMDTNSTELAKLGTPAADVSADIAAVKVDTAAIVVDTNELQTDDIPGKIAALNDIAVADILTTQMTEAYAADGTAPTLAQALFLIQQSIGDFSIAGTTITAKRLDGTTTAATYTLDDGTNPTSRTRAT